MIRWKTSASEQVSKQREIKIAMIEREDLETRTHTLLYLIKGSTMHITGTQGSQVHTGTIHNRPGYARNGRRRG